MFLLKGSYVIFFNAPYSKRLCGKCEAAERLALGFRTVDSYINYEL